MNNQERYYRTMLDCIEFIGREQPHRLRFVTDSVEREKIEVLMTLLVEFREQLEYALGMYEQQRVAAILRQGNSAQPSPTVH